MSSDLLSGLPSFPEITIRIRILPEAERAIRRRSPWLFDHGIKDVSGDGPPGALAALYGRGREFVAVGLYDPNSPLRVRVLRHFKPAIIDRGWFAGLACKAAERRRKAGFGGETTGFRLVNGESEGFPGLVLDLFGRVAVLKVYTAAWMPWLSTVAPVLFEASGAAAMVFRSSRSAMEAFAAHGLADGCALMGDWDGGSAEFAERGMRFLAHPGRGQKTGFYLDQRDNRGRTESLAAGKRVLDAFSFSGGFSVAAARGGAVEVLSLDSDAHALESVAEHFRLNRHFPGVAACRHRAMRCDVFEALPALARDGERFGLVVVDPPNLAPQERNRPAALSAFRMLAGAAAAVAEEGGTVAVASCSSHVREDEFLAAVRAGFASAGRRTAEECLTGLPADHPASFAEAKYLRCLFAALVT